MLTPMRDLMAKAWAAFRSLNRSVVAFHRLIGRRRPAHLLLCALLICQTALLSYSAFVHSPTINEPGHLAAGIVHWRFDRFDVYNVNPPLIKMIAALPVIAAGCREDWTGFYSTPAGRPEIALGQDLIAANGERSLFLFSISRLACLPFSWLGCIVCFLFARDLFGRAAGIAASTMWVFEPNTLAHSSLITPDAHAAALGIAACYTFWQWIVRPTWTGAALCGITLGLAVLSKSTLLLLAPLFPSIWLLFRIVDWHFKSYHAAKRREIAMLALQLITALLVLNLGYGFKGTGTRLGDFRFVSDLFTGRQSMIPNARLAPVAPPTNRFADTSWHYLPLPVPADFVQGIDLQQLDFEHAIIPSYLRGQFRRAGWWYYYLYGCLVKVPVALLLLASITGLRMLRSNARYLWRENVFLCLTALLFALVVSAKTGLNHHFRYLLPAAPLLFIWVSQALTGGRSQVIQPASRAPAQPWLAPLYMLLLWFIGSSLWIYPHSLSYFNELVGGPANGHKHLLHSNVDWGQDLRYFKSWCDRQPIGAVPFLAYSGTYDPAHLGIHYRAPEHLPTGSGSGPTAEGRYAVSVNCLYGFPWINQPVKANPGSLFRGSEDYASHARGRIGYTFLLFRVSPHVEK